MNKIGKLVGVCNCQCHCDLRKDECISSHDIVCEHCQKVGNMYTLGTIKTAEDAMDAIRDEFNNIGMGGEKKLTNLQTILQDYDAVWKPINSHFYLTLDRMFMERKNDKVWVKMYEKIKYDILEDKEAFSWRITFGEIEVNKLPTPQSVEKEEG